MATLYLRRTVNGLSVTGHRMRRPHAGSAQHGDARASSLVGAGRTGTDDGPSENEGERTMTDPDYEHAGTAAGDDETGSSRETAPVENPSG